MKRTLVTGSMLGLFAIGLAGCMSLMSFDIEKPLPVITENANTAVMLAPLKGAAARPAHTELASFAAG